MRLSHRTLSYSATLAVLAAALAGCSSSHGLSTPVLPAEPSHPTSMLRAPLSVGAFPISIDAFPASVGASPISASAFPICNVPNAAGQAQCHSQYRSDVPVNGNSASAIANIAGYHPSDLQAAYGLNGGDKHAGRGQTVAIVVAYHNPNLSADLAIYRNAFGLRSCDSDCLTVLTSGASDSRNNNSAARTLAKHSSAPGTPSYDAAWGAEEVLDAEMVSAICPNCQIMVVETQDAQISSLAQGVAYAVAYGATEVSNSYTVPETPDLSQYASYYAQPGVPITAGAGDNGYGPGFPATLATVTAVGGASLVNTPTGWGQAVWPGTGSGCSSFVPKPRWQTDPGCTTRTVNDLAVVADPATGVSAYVSAIGGWAVFGGTSVGAPIVAGMYALAGNGENINDPSILYANASSFGPVTSRSNGTCPSQYQYLCNGTPGYDGPSGLGMPVGLSAF
jgi:subtilase family serine protease